MTVSRTHLLTVTAAIMVAAFVVSAAAQIPTTILNPASDLQGKTLVTAEGNRTISGTFTYSVPALFATGTTNAPGIVGSADTGTGWGLSVGSISASLGGVQEFLLNSVGLTVYGVKQIDNTGIIMATALGTGTPSSTSLLRGDRTWQPINTIVAPPSIQCGRVTLTTGVPVTITDVTAATTVYFSPVNSCNQITLWNGTTNQLDSLVEQSIAVPATTNTVYDVFAFDNAGTANIEILAWTSTTARATAVTVQNGYYAKASTPARRWVGSFATTGTSGQTEDSQLNRLVCNYSNVVPRYFRLIDTTDSWGYSTATWRQARASTANQVKGLVCITEMQIDLRLNAFLSQTSTGGQQSVAIGEDSITVPATNAINITGSVAGANIYVSSSSSLVENPTLGIHTWAWLEFASIGGTGTFFGDNGAVAAAQSGLIGFIR